MFFAAGCSSSSQQITLSTSYQTTQRFLPFSISLATTHQTFHRPPNSGSYKYLHVRSPFIFKLVTSTESNSNVVMARFTIFLVALFLLHLSYGSQAQLGFGQQSMGQPFSSMRRLGYRSQCQLERLTALEPTRRVPSEAGFTEYFDQNNEQLQCAAVTAHRRTIMPRGLLLPSFSSAPSLVYILQGKGMMGMVMPGCPETYQSFRQMEQQMGEETSQSQRFRDEHQRIHYFREGDVIAMPAGVAHWCYNYGEVPVVAVTVTDIGSNANQFAAGVPAGRKRTTSPAAIRAGTERTTEDGEESPHGLRPRAAHTGFRSRRGVG